MEDIKVGASKKDDAAGAAKVGFGAMMKGEGDLVSGWKNKLQTVMASVTPAGLLAEQHAKWWSRAVPRSGRLSGGVAPQ